MKWNSTFNIFRVSFFFLPSNAFYYCGTSPSELLNNFLRVLVANRFAHIMCEFCFLPANDCVIIICIVVGIKQQMVDLIEGNETEDEEKKI